MRFSIKTDSCQGMWRESMSPRQCTKECNLIVPCKMHTETGAASDGVKKELKNVSCLYNVSWSDSLRRKMAVKHLQAPTKCKEERRKLESFWRNLINAGLIVISWKVDCGVVGVEKGELSPCDVELTMKQSRGWVIMRKLAENSVHSMWYVLCYL